MIGFVHQTLADLFLDIPVKVLSPSSLAETPVTDVAFDSRSVRPGNLFVALVGETVDGHRFIPSAIERGAAAVVGSQPIGELSVPYIQVEDTRFALAHLSAAFYGFPARRLTVIGVTGTDGKTTTSNLIFQILLSAGLRAGVISTISAVIGDEVLDTGYHVTTPEAPDVQRYLARMVDSGLTHVVLESTSHGLAQHRVTACEFDIGVVTNITHEHLDYHGTYEAYRAAKGRLFTGLEETRPKKHGNPRLAVLNRDDQSYEYLNSLAHVRRVDYSLQENAQVRAKNIRYGPGGIDFTAAGEDFRVPIHSDLVGAFNVSNILAAIAATVVGLDIPDETAARGIAAMGCVPGRMERIDLGQDFTAIVDFAHTPNALQRTLETVRQMVPGRILAVFGSAGLRDRQKRRMMAEVSAAMADLTILTAEDPRTELLEDILAEMAQAAAQNGGIEGKTFWREPDRGDALRLAVQMARPGDLVIACGKGHEQSMCFGTTEYAWDDRTAMQAALAECLGISGPKMPYLPTQARK
ncbi:MAG: UDP-N-acetylmuramoyl-L-alanyl-D-glutamate--2,6-diaminopimelate ligase [Anaerolineaceae bacterium]|jgi:UDP-N-acetylmuramoyl-L-alanyl-D-glutamate--2,6-diaminopimelate ligase